MYYSELCEQLTKFVQGEVPLSKIHTCFNQYWVRIFNDSEQENEDIIVKVQILQIAVEAYSVGRYLKEDLIQTINQFTIEAEH